VFVTLPDAQRYAFVGDIVWQLEGITRPAERPWPSRRLVDLDADAVRTQIAHLAALHARFPAIRMVPAHDARAAAGIPVLSR
jgi:N-acyl homoserine lactone hydrolase